MSSTVSDQPDDIHWAPSGPYWHGIDHLLRHAGPLSSALDPSSASGTQSFLREHCKLLIIGAGGLGCELLKAVALSGFRNIHVIDMDTVDVTNLNRQFLFRRSDVGKPKASVAAAYINAVVPSARVTPHHANITHFDADFYRQFTLVIAGLDSVDARRWLNATLLSLVSFEDDKDQSSVDQSTVVPLIDGGTEGFQGQARLIVPYFSACFECTLGLFPPATTFPLCTIANTPRLPEHCIEYAHVVLWPKHKPFGEGAAVADMDNADHVEWLFKTALDRARQFSITGVTYRLTQGVVKNIVPAVASTNAVIASACVNEALKMVTSMASTMDNYMMYNGTDGIYTFTYKNERRPDCPVCGTPAPRKLSIASSSLLSDFVDVLSADPDIRSRHPFLRTIEGKTLYASAPPPLQKATTPNLEKAMSDLVSSPVEITLTDRDLPFARTIILTLTL